MIAMYRDKIVEEVRRARAKVVEKAGGDLASLVEYLRRRQIEDGAKVVRLKPKRAKRAKRKKRSSK
jgi:hypothetical protein